MTGRARARADAQLLGSLDRALTPRRRATLPGFLWAWRKELALLSGAAVLLTGVALSFGIAWAVVGLAITAGAFSPPWPRWLAAFWWELRTPHLLRSGMYHARVQNRDGRRPFIVRVTGEPFGERVRLWCPVGTSAEDLYAAREVLRAACRAADVRVRRDERRSHLVTVDVIRNPGPGGTPDGDTGGW